MIHVVSHYKALRCVTRRVTYVFLQQHFLEKKIASDGAANRNKNENLRQANLSKALKIYIGST